MKKCIFICSIIFILCTFVGCGSAEVVIAEPAFEINKKGEIVQTMVESFEKEYYSVDELKAELETALSDVSNKTDESIELQNIYAENGKVFVKISYDTSSLAKSFLDEDIYFGTVNDAYDAGYLLDVNLKSVSDGLIIGKNELMGMKKNHIFICPESGMVYLDYKILYASANVEVIDDKSARVSSDSDGLAYIVTK